MTTPVSRRDLLRTGGAALAALSVGATAHAQTPKLGGTFVSAQTTEATGLDPQLVPAFSRSRRSPMLYNQLVRFDADMNPVPELAESWRVSPDGLTWAFKLREGVRFHDGQELTSADVKFTFDRLFEKSPGKSDFIAVDRVEPAGSYAVRFVTKEPFAGLLAALGGFWGFIISEAGITKHGDLNKAALGTGPFVLQDWKVEQQMVLTRHPQYFKKGLPRVDEVILRIIPDEANIVAALRTGQIHHAFLEDNKNFNLLKDEKTLTGYRSSRLGYDFLNINASRGPLRDVRVRQAISWAVDRSQVLRVAASGFGRLTAPATAPMKQWQLHGRGRGRREPAEPRGGDAQHLAPIHGPADRLSHADVPERPAARVDVEEVVAETGAPVAGQRLLVLQEVEVLVVLEEGVVDLARAERRDDIRLVRDDPEDDLVHVGQPLLEVVRVALEDHLLLDLPVLQHEGARAEGGRVEVAVLLDPGLAEDEAPEAAERREEPREGLLRQELHPVAPRGLDAVHRDEVRLPGRLLEEPVEGELDVGGGQLLAVVEAHALAELEGPREPVRADLPGLGELRHGGHLGVEADELVVHHGRAAAARERRDELRVEAGRLGRLRRDEGAARLRRLRVRGPADGERGEGCAAGFQEISSGPRGRHRCGSFSVLWLVRCQGVTGRWGRGYRASRRRSG